MKIFVALVALLATVSAFSCPALSKVGSLHHDIHISYPEKEYVEEKAVKEKYQYGDRDYLGNGTIGSVWLGKVPAHCKLEGHFQPVENQKVAIKRPLFGQEKWMHHEAVIAERLAENDPEGMFMRASYDPQLNVLVSEYLEGMVNLEEFMDQRKSKLTQFERDKILLQLNQALSILHSLRLVHSDLKPNNIMIDPKTNRIKVIDYSLVAPIGGYPLANGVGKMRGGSSGYASESQRLGNPAKFSDDVFSIQKLEEFLSK